MTKSSISKNSQCPIQGAASSRVEWESKNLNKGSSDFTV